MGRNIVKFKKVMTPSLIRKYDVIIILMSRQLKFKVFIVCFWMDKAKI